MKAIACLGNYAKIPYYFEKLDIRVFCMEELCCCLKENAFLLGREIMNDNLLKFISNECDVPQLARELYPLVHKRGNLSTFVVMILEYVAFYSAEEIRRVETVLKQGANMSDYEKQKIQIDYMVGKKKYAAALDEYTRLYERMPKDARAGAVLHNKGVIYAHMMMYQKAAEAFKEAYELSGANQTFIAYLGAKRFDLTDKEYVDFVAELTAQYSNEMELEQILEQANEEWENSETYLGILNLKEWRQEGSNSKYEEESARILQDMIKEYKDGLER